VGFSKWTVLIGRMGFDTIPSIPDPTLSLTQNFTEMGAVMKMSTTNVQHPFAYGPVECAFGCMGSGGSHVLPSQTPRAASAPLLPPLRPRPVVDMADTSERTPLLHAPAAPNRSSVAAPGLQLLRCPRLHLRAGAYTRSHFRST